MRSDGTADKATRRELLRVEQPFANHNGGNIAFGPDGMLYIGLGDGGSAGDPEGNGQDLGTLLGKILRIDPRPSGNAPYSVPNDNPFASDADARAEIWMYGLRNPWRFSWDRVTRDLWIGDVGQNEWEEIDFAPAGEQGLNFGWNAREGAHDFEGSVPDGVVDPIYEYSHADGGVSVTGGFVYRGTAIPELAGAYVFADFAQGDLIVVKQDDGVLTDERDLGVNAGAVSTFGEDSSGELYVADISGRALRLDPS
ncbi:MAG: PQQ-dependent sugar dehydrogenase [Acidimicrobiia bacterium]|nr:PQQ-dependent sugar dehydrogenase [Acidimicrobiia bacterium]